MTTTRSVTISLPTFAGLRSRVRMPRVPLGRLGRGRWRLVVIALILIVGATDLPLVRQAAAQVDRADSRAAAVRSAEERLPVMLPYSYRSLDGDLTIASGNTTGSFREQYAAVLTEVVAPNLTEKKITTKAEVVGSSVVSGGGDDVTVLLYLMQSTLTVVASMPSSGTSRSSAKLAISSARRNTSRPSFGRNPSPCVIGSFTVTGRPICRSCSTQSKTTYQS